MRVQMQPVTQLSQDTVDSIHQVIEDKMQNRECFFALDVSNQVKHLGYNTKPPSNFGSHRLMRPLIENYCKAQAQAFGYSWALLDVAAGDDQSYLYFPDGTSTATIQSHVNRQVSPLMPVEVFAAQVSQQASGVQSQASRPNGSVPSDAGQAVVAPLKDTVPTGVMARLGQHITKLLGS